MPNFCVVPFCNNDEGGFRFPKDGTLRTQWELAVKRKDWSPTPYSVVCKRHFDPDDFISSTKTGTPRAKAALKTNAVPSIFQWSEQGLQRKRHTETHDSNMGPVAKKYYSEDDIPIASQYNTCSTSHNPVHKVCYATTSEVEDDEDEEVLTMLQCDSPRDRLMFLHASKNRGNKGFEVILTDGSSVWEGSISEEDLHCQSIALSMDFETFVKETILAFKSASTGTTMFRCVVCQEDVTSVQLLWQKVEEHNIMCQLGNVKLEKVKGQRAATLLCSVLAQCVSSTQNLLAKISALRTDNRELKERLEKCKQVKERHVTTLYSKITTKFHTAEAGALGAKRKENLVCLTKKVPAANPHRGGRIIQIPVSSLRRRSSAKAKSDHSVSSTSGAPVEKPNPTSCEDDHTEPPVPCLKGMEKSCHDIVSDSSEIHSRHSESIPARTLAAKKKKKWLALPTEQGPAAIDEDKSYNLQAANRQRSNTIDCKANAEDLISSGSTSDLTISSNNEAPDITSVPAVTSYPRASKHVGAGSADSEAVLSKPPPTVSQYNTSQSNPDSDSQLLDHKYSSQHTDPVFLDHNYGRDSTPGLSDDNYSTASSPAHTSQSNDSCSFSSTLCTSPKSSTTFQLQLDWDDLNTTVQSPRTSSHSKNPSDKVKNSCKNYYKCFNCGEETSNINSLIFHYNRFHEKGIEVSKKKFKTLGEFYAWKTETELTTHTNFVKICGTRVYNGKTIYKYMCNRSGRARSKVGTHARKRTLKSQGSSKLNSHCTAFIKAVQDKESHELNVDYCLHHEGHSCEMGHLHLSDAIKSEVANKLSEGLNADEVLDFIRGNMPAVGRDSLITRTDINNIKKSHGIL